MGNNKKMTKNSFKNYLNEGKKQYLYHGQNYPADPFKGFEKKYKRMNWGNQQEGPGIYFGDLETAKGYGDHIYKTKEKIDSINFLNSRKLVKDYKGLLRKIPLFLKELHKIDPEPMFYNMSDWIELSDPKDIRDWHFDEMKENLKYEEIRNFLITYSELYEDDFVRVFNKVYPLYYGTFNPNLNFYAFLKPVKVEKV